MRFKAICLVVVGLVFSIVNTAIVLAQDEAMQDEIVQVMPNEETPATPDLQWIWAEVVSIDPLKSTLDIRYLDYETDTEKEITIVVTEKTTFENVKSINDIKPLDTVSIDYITDAEGKNIAKNITVEKVEEVEPQGETIKQPATEEKASETESDTTNQDAPRPMAEPQTPQPPGAQAPAQDTTSAVAVPEATVASPQQVAAPAAASQPLLPPQPQSAPVAGQTTPKETSQNDQ